VLLLQAIFFQKSYSIVGLFYSNILDLETIKKDYHYRH